MTISITNESVKDMFDYLDVNAIEHWLKETDEEKLELLWQAADKCRRDNVGDPVHLRGLVEVSNFCQRHCAYCGIRVNNSRVERYLMSMEEILECVDKIVKFNYGTIVMQAGEDDVIEPQWMAGVIRKIKAKTNLAVTLSLGEKDIQTLAMWKKAGADRYLIRFETSDPHLYKVLHPGSSGLKERLLTLENLRSLGYELGSGVMIGLPGQSYRTLAEDIDMFRTMELHMIGVGPYIAHPDTPLFNQAQGLRLPPEIQVPNDELMAYKVIALTRLTSPKMNIPATTAISTINKKSGRANGLSRGGNVIMPNVTPLKYRALYEIYPGKASSTETAEETYASIMKLLQEMGREPGSGKGCSPGFLESR